MITSGPGCREVTPTRQRVRVTSQRRREGGGCGRPWRRPGGKPEVHLMAMTRPGPAPVPDQAVPWAAAPAAWA